MDICNYCFEYHPEHVVCESYITEIKQDEDVFVKKSDFDELLAMADKLERELELRQRNINLNSEREASIFVNTMSVLAEYKTYRAKIRSGDV
jgi:hypothetical protein